MTFLICFKRQFPKPIGNIHWTSLQASADYMRSRTRVFSAHGKF